MTKPNVFSQTEELCTCGFLEDAASGYHEAIFGNVVSGASADRPVRFEPSTNEYYFKAVGGMEYRIYHCFLCGGAAPQALPRSDYAIITADEEARINSLMESVKSLQDAKAKLGEPDMQDVDARIYKDADGKQTTERLRRIIYQRLSPLADLWITENLDRTIDYSLQSKRIDDSNLFDWSTVPRHLRPGYLPSWKKVVLRTIGVKHA